MNIYNIYLSVYTHLIMAKCLFINEHGSAYITTLSNINIKNMHNKFTVGKVYTIIYGNNNNLNSFFQQYNYHIYGDAVVIKNNASDDVEENLAELLPDILKNDNFAFALLVSKYFRTCDESLHTDLVLSLHK